jgi:20S proteasome subunit alpha 3
MITIVIGQNNQAGKSLLKTDYAPDNNVQKNLKLAVKILLKTMDSVTPSPDRIELSYLKLSPQRTVEHTTLTDIEVNVLIEEIQKEEASEQKKSEAVSGDM